MKSSIRNCEILPPSERQEGFGGDHYAETNFQFVSKPLFTYLPSALHGNYFYFSLFIAFDLNFTDLFRFAIRISSRSATFTPLCLLHLVALSLLL
mmetsp:Transcript_30897/g.35187  ORF Transcript_30897/g.35187 Transcript_30897/m.35187 type:complete len:95 (+) Transcript_30897:1429-1713(+)